MIEEELKQFAVKFAAGNTTEGDLNRVRQIGEALKRGVPVPDTQLVLPSIGALEPPDDQEEEEKPGKSKRFFRGKKA